MIKKIIGTVIALFFSLGSATTFAQNPVQKSPKKWNPEAKPSTNQAFYDKKGNAVDIKNLAEVKGKVLYDKKGNAFEIQKGQIIRLQDNRQLQKRVGPAPVA
ncbi:MAG: hypothetical protein ABFR31_10900 [Thermodesulfobacteriota bacterium]